jgi:hypothetical protein
MMKLHSLSSTVMIFLFGLIIVSTAHSSNFRHDISPVFNYTQIQTEDRTMYQFYSPGLNYFVLLGEKHGPFISSTLFFPAGGSESVYDFGGGGYDNSNWTSLWEYYNVPIGFDFLFGLATNFPSKFTVKGKHSDHMEFGAGIGIHMNGIFLRNTNYENRYSNSLTLGFGLDLRAMFKPGKNFYMGLMFNGNFDFFDLLNTDNQMASFFNLNTGIVFGFRTGKGGE